jgi:ribosome biogenesis GTPase A
MSLCLLRCRQQIIRFRLNKFRSIVVHQRKFTSNLPLLDRSHHELVKRIKNLLINVQSDLTILSSSDKKLLNEAQTNIDSIFLLVVVGEFNSGKSQFINALLKENEEICPTGVLPTTDVIHILKYGTKRQEIIESDHVKSIYLPNEWLRQTNIVDTPGTNAILQTHQQITGMTFSRRIST